MHAIQLHILQKLTFVDEARYSELKPEGVESNRFVYHLKSLIADRFVEKTSSGYKLTTQGKRHVGKLSLQTLQPRFQSKIVTVIICQNEKGEHLLMTWKRQPFLGYTAFPYGKTHFGESIREAAARELKEKSGLSAKLTHCGDAYLSIRERGELISHMLCHAFWAEQPKGEMLTEGKTHTTEWCRLKDVPKTRLIPGFLKLNNLASKFRKTKTRFFTEIVT